MTDQAKIIKSIVVPRLNANEDELTLVEVCVKEGDHVTDGQLLFVVESTKTTSDIINSDEGYIRNVSVENGCQIEVGATLCVIADRADGEISTEATAPTNQPTASTDKATIKPAPPATKSTDQVLATASAQLLAAEHDIELASLGLDRIITGRDIRALVAGDDPRKPSGRTTDKVNVLPISSHHSHVSIPNSGPSVPELVILGAGSHARALVELIRVSRPEIRVVAAVDDAPGCTGDILGVPIVGDSTHLSKLREQGVRYAGLGVGAATNPQLRKKLFQRLADFGFELPSFIHPNARVEPTVTMGVGNQIFAGAIVGTLVTLGDNTLINCGSVISHDCKIGSHSHITPGAILAGAVTVGENSTIGMGCTVFLGTKVGDSVIIGNGIHVFEDVADGVFVRPKKSVGRAA